MRPGYVVVEYLVALVRGATDWADVGPELWVGFRSALASISGLAFSGDLAASRAAASCVVPVRGRFGAVRLANILPRHGSSSMRHPQAPTSVASNKVGVAVIRSRKERRVSGCPSSGPDRWRRMATSLPR